MNVRKQNSGLSVRAYQGDAKTLLAFNLTKAKIKNLAGFTIAYSPGETQQPLYVQNNLRFKDPSKHAQDASKPANSSLNSPIHKFRWVQVPGSLNQGTKPFYGAYTYTVTPRYFDETGSLLAIDPAKSLSVKLDVGPFNKGNVEVGNTRGFVQSQAFVHHFGPKAIIRPKGDELLFDTSQVAGKSNTGQDYTFAEEYDWLGFTAEDKILAILNEVRSKKNLRLDMFAYDLNAPDILNILLELAEKGRVRLILDNAGLHHASDGSKPEDKFEKLFKQKAKAPAEIMRGRFDRYAHHKVLIVSNENGPIKVLTGSTNFSVTGLYVNSNHVLIFNEPRIATVYAQVFKDVWEGKVSAKKFRQTGAASQPFKFPSATAPQIEINFSPHEDPYATKILNDMAARITNEGTQKNGSVLFAVMGISGASGAVLPALQNVHRNEEIFSYGISDSPDGIFLYTPRKKTGVLVSGKPNKTKLPPPFDQVPQIGLGHQVHHKFVVCGFNGKKPVVYCGSSNLALGGEQENGDNLIAIYDEDIATVFAIEALALVDHFDFLDRSASEAGQAPTALNSPSNQHLAAEAGWFLSTSDRWVTPYFDNNDLRCTDRELFA
jgi:phosphatidylserine/phosphatidylglycerophosphate/cardiolipin synthase-like enzyme